MTLKDLRANRVYTDGEAAVRKIQRITSLSPGHGEGEYQSVIYLELAGLNRGRINSMPLSQFAAFASRSVAPTQVHEAIVEIGLNAYAIDDRTKSLCVQAIANEDKIIPQPDDHARLERLAGFGLARRVGARTNPEYYVMGYELAAAARVTGAEALPLAA